jgi:hypothetical protein
MAAKSYFGSLAEFALEAYLPPSSRTQDQLINRWGGGTGNGGGGSRGALRDDWHEEPFNQALAFRRERERGDAPHRKRTTQALDLKIRDSEDPTTRGQSCRLLSLDACLLLPLKVTL